MDALSGTVLQSGGQKWRVGAKLGSGSWGAVFECSKDGSTSEQAGKWAIKVAQIVQSGKNKMDANVLNSENMLYTNILRWHPHLPVVPLGGFSDCNGFRFLVLQRLHQTLHERMKNGTPDLPTACTIALQALDTLAHFHTNQYCYVDVNAHNIMFGGPQLGGGYNCQPSDVKSLHGKEGVKRLPGGLYAPLNETGERVYLVDLGLASKYSALGPTSTLPAKEAGTPLFSSTAAAKGKIQCPRNDCESLGYLLAYLLGGGQSVLPWHSGKSVEEVSALKMKASAGELAAAVGRGKGAAAGKEAAGIVADYFKALDAMPYTIKGPFDYSALRAPLLKHAGKGGDFRFVPQAAGEGGGVAARAAPGNGTGRPAAKSKGQSASSPAPTAGKKRASRAVAAPVEDEAEEEEIQVVEVSTGRGRGRAARAPAPGAPPATRKASLSPAAAAAAGRKTGQKSPRDAAFPPKRGAKGLKSLPSDDEEGEEGEGEVVPVVKRSKPSPKAKKESPKAYLRKPLPPLLAVPTPSPKEERGGRKTARAALARPHKQQQEEEEEDVVEVEEDEGQEVTPRPAPGRKSATPRSAAPASRRTATPRSTGGRSSRSSRGGSVRGSSPAGLLRSVRRLSTGMVAGVMSAAWSAGKMLGLGGRSSLSASGGSGKKDEAKSRAGASGKGRRAQEEEEEEDSDVEEVEEE